MIKKRKIGINIIIFILFIISTLTLSYTGILIGNIIDSISIKQWDNFIFNISIFFILLVINVLSSYISWNLIYKLGFKFLLDKKNKLFEVDVRKDIESNINIANYTTNMDRIYTNHFLAKYNILNQILIIFFSTISILSIDYKMLILSFIASGFPLLSPILFNQKIKEKSILFNDYYNYYQGYINERLSKRIEFDNYNVYEGVCKEKEDVEKENESKRIDLRKINFTSSLLSGSLGSFSYIIIFLAGGYLVFNNEISVGSIVSIIQLMNYLVEPIISIAGILNSKKEAEPLLSIVNNNINREIKVSEKIDLKYPLKLEVKNISYRVGNNDIIKNFSYTFENNKKYLIRGESGKGKTCLAKIISGLIKPDLGVVTINKYDISKFRRQDYITYINQSPIILNATVGDNIKFYRKSNDKLVSKLLNKYKINKNINDRINSDSNLSGGEKMKISLARVDFEYKPIIVYDEPTSSIDKNRSKLIINEILNRKAIAIVIAHNLNEEIAIKFDHIINI